TQPPNNEPANFIIPYLSRRKVADYSEAVQVNAANAVASDLRYLSAKVDRLADSYHPAFEAYTKACETIIGFRVGAAPSPGGKNPAIRTDAYNYIPIEALGEGVPNLLGLIVSLCLAEDRLFLIEEPENDVHPRALKALLDFIVDRSEANQFIVSTHSNIVV